MPHPIENIISATMERLKTLISVNTVVGEPIRMENDSVILPVSRVSVGFVVGGGEYEKKRSIERCGRSLDEGSDALPFAGATAAGIAVTPVSFLTVRGEQVSALPAQYTGCAVERIIDAIPGILTACQQMASSLCKEQGRSAHKDRQPEKDTENDWV